MHVELLLYLKKKEEICLNPMTKTLTPTEKFKKHRDNNNNNNKKRHKNFDYTTIADRLWTVSLSNSSHPTGVAKPVYERSTFPLTAKVVCVINRSLHDRNIVYNTNRLSQRCIHVKSLSKIK